MDDVARWLRGLGLQQYAETFDVNKIDFDSLCLLSDQDLQQMQVPLGPRRKLLAAISALTGPDRHVVQSQGDTERRHVTALFCDLVASTEYAVRLDPEDFLDLTNRYIERCSSVVKDHNGTVVSVTGDAFLALFGYPAEEDDADRALRAALDVLRIAPSIEVPEGPPVQVRIGIATGLAVVGGADSGRISASGPIPNLAQRLQTAAAPQTILIDQRTYDATAGAFEYTDMGLHTLKGFAEPVKAWRVGSPACSRVDLPKRRDCSSWSVAFSSCTISSSFGTTWCKATVELLCCPESQVSENPGWHSKFDIRFHNVRIWHFSAQRLSVTAPCSLFSLCSSAMSAFEPKIRLASRWASSRQFLHRAKRRRPCRYLSSPDCSRSTKRSSHPPS